MKFNKLLKESQFHGGRRLAERNCRWCWSIAILVLFGSAVTVICITVWRFFNNPTFMVQLESAHKSMEFPSVLVCPEISFHKDKINQFLAKLQIPPYLNLTYLNGVMHMLAAFFSPDILYSVRDLMNIELLLEFNNMNKDTAGRLLMTSCESNLIRCRWKGVIINCSSLFHMVLTGDGYCCVFNGRSLSVELGNGVHRHNVSSKWYTKTFGYTSGLMMAINQSQTNPIDLDLSYKWLALQSGQHYVESTINGTPLSPGSEHWVQYHIQSFQIAEEARSISPSIRKCRLAHESLKYFPNYNKKYCVVECEMVRTLERCNCVRLVHPRPNDAPYCKASQLECAQHNMVSYDSDQCDCPPACDVATDYVKITSFDLLPSVTPIDTFYDGLDFGKITVVRAFVQNREVRINSRWSYFSNIDLFSQLGGVFNVFFGCSILTLLELVVLALRGIRSFAPHHKTDVKGKQNCGKLAIKQTMRRRRKRKQRLRF